MQRLSRPCRVRIMGGAFLLLVGAAGGQCPAREGNLKIAVLSDLNGPYGSLTYEERVHAAVQHLIGTEHPDLVLITETWWPDSAVGWTTRVCGRRFMHR